MAPTAAVLPTLNTCTTPVCTPDSETTSATKAVRSCMSPCPAVETVRCFWKTIVLSLPDRLAACGGLRFPRSISNRTPTPPENANAIIPLRPRLPAGRDPLGTGPDRLPGGAKRGPRYPLRTDGPHRPLLPRARPGPAGGERPLSPAGRPGPALPVAGRPPHRPAHSRPAPGAAPAQPVRPRPGERRHKARGSAERRPARPGRLV